MNNDKNHHKKLNSLKTWTCDACKITLESEKAFKNHRRSHVKCSACDFEGAPKIVQIHYQTIHGKFSVSGFKTISVAIPGCRTQKYKICVGNRPEDIQRWIAERKKRFPRTTFAATSTTTTALNNYTSTNTNTLSTIEADKKPPETKGTNNRQYKEEMNDMADTGLSSLLAGYGSSDDSDKSDKEDQDSNHNTFSKSSTTTNLPNEITGDNPSTYNDLRNCSIRNKPVEIVENTVPTTTTGTNATAITHQQRTFSRPCRFFIRQGSCRYGENCRFSHEKNQEQQLQYSQHQRPLLGSRLSSNPTSDSKNVKKRKRGCHTSSDTLLRQLVKNEILRESTFTMQLLKHIVDNNFFFDDNTKENCTKNPVSYSK